MISKKEFGRILKEFMKPRKELQGRSYADERKSKFTARFTGLPQLLLKQNLSSLTLSEAEIIFRKATTGNPNTKNLSVHRFLENDIDTVRNHLSRLLYGKPLHECFTEAIDTLDQVNVDLASTLLHINDPKKYGIWNTPVIETLKRIGRPVLKVRGETAGKRYERLNGLLKDIAFTNDFQSLDIVDELLYMIWKGDLKLKELVEPVEEKRTPMATPPKKESPPDKVVVQSLTFKRDPQVVRDAKDAEFSTCQICKTPIIKKDGSFYCEVHHIQPLSAGGLDEVMNVIVLCPNHHAEMALGLFYIDPDNRRIIFYDKKNEYHGNKIHPTENPKAKVFHRIAPEYLKYHMEKIYGKK